MAQSSSFRPVHDANPDRKRRIKVGVAAVVTFALVSVGCAGMASAAKRSPKQPTAAPTSGLTILRVAKKVVSRSTSAAPSFAPAIDKSAVGSGDRLRTDKSGRATVEFADGTAFRIGKSTELSVSDLALDASVRRLKLTLANGSLYVRIPKANPGTEWVITTPAGSVTVRGGNVAITCAAASCTAAASDGTATVTTSAGTADVSSGLQVAFSLGQAPSAATPLTPTADLDKGLWLICNASRDRIATPNGAFVKATNAACSSALGPAPTPALGFTFLALPAPPAATTKPPVTPSPVTPVTPTTFPTRPTNWKGTGDLTASILENPFRCDGKPPRNYVGYSGLVPGETLTWVWGVAGSPPTQKGVSSAGSTSTGFSIWACSPSQAGTVWTFTMTTGTGNSITYDLVGGPP